MKEQAADWSAQWRGEPIDVDAVAREAETPRWRAQEELVQRELGGFVGLRAIEVGAGRGTNAALYAQRGAHVTLLDMSPVALEQAREVFDALDLEAEYVEADAFALPEELRGAFDVSMSFGLCEHFLGERRRAIVAAHLELVRPGGLALLAVPNRFGIVYRAWMGALKRTGSWPLGTEVPFDARELAALVRDAGGEPLPPRYGSFAGSVVSHGVNQVLFKLGRRGLAVPQVALPVVDRLAYELLVPARRL
jgi:2-polyprenyl-3-methyl-5-hydroxy-6-metoxy-1,4-benzoquinol methylase